MSPSSRPFQCYQVSFRIPAPQRRCLILGNAFCRWRAVPASMAAWHAASPAVLAEPAARPRVLRPRSSRCSSFPQPTVVTEDSAPDTRSSVPGAGLTTPHWPFKGQLSLCACGSRPLASGRGRQPLVPLRTGLRCSCSLVFWVGEFLRLGPPVTCLLIPF